MLGWGGEGRGGCDWSPELNSVFMFCPQPAGLWVSVCEAPLAIGFDSSGCNWLAGVIG